MDFFYLSVAVILFALAASFHQHFIKKQSIKPKWIYRLHHAAFFAGAYIIIQYYSASAFLFFVVIISSITKIYDVARAKYFPRSGEASLLTEFSRDIWLLALLFWLFRTFIIDYSPIPSGSMEPTLLTGDLIAVNKLAYQVKIPPFQKPLYHFNSPKVGDVVVFNPPYDPHSFYVKRVIAVGGDRVEYRNKQYFVNGVPYTQSDRELSYDKKYAPVISTINENTGGVEHKIQVDDRQFDDPLAITVPEGHYFVSGDNRDFSMDSRYFGPIPEDSIVGKAQYVLIQFKLPLLLNFTRTGSVT